MSDAEGSDTGRLGTLEFFAMNNPIREWRMKYREFPLVREMLRVHGIGLTGKTIVDMGCGSGYSTGLLLSQFSPSRIIAFDIMPEQIRLARKRNLGVDFTVGDVTAMKISDSSCDAVFDFSILHHVPSWKKTFSESARVLVPGGIFFIEEPHATFGWDEFESGIRKAGFEILEQRCGHFGYFRFYLCRKVHAV